MNKLICFVGPSGVGKSSYIRRLRKLFNVSVPQVVTTRKKREDDGRHYTYVTLEEFQEMKMAGRLVEYDQYSGYFYGTLKDSVLDILERTQNFCVLDLTPGGCSQIKREFSEAKIIALLPDDLSWLEERLRERGTDDLSEIKKRTESLVKFVEKVEKLDACIVLCQYHSSTWDSTFEEIVQVVMN